MPTNNALQKVSPSNALLWLEFRTQYDVVSATNAIVDGDMESATTASWTPFNNATLTKETGTRTGGSGSRVLRVAYNGTYPPVAAQAITAAANAPYRITGWFRGDGANAYPRLYLGTGTTPYSGTTSSSWQYFDVTQASSTANPYLNLYGYINAPGWVEFDDVKVQPVIRVTDNLGRAPGAPRLCKLGDGATSTKFTSQLVGRHGASFDGGDYIDTGIPAFERTDVFSLFVAISGMTKSSNRTLMSTRISTTSYFAWYYLNGYWIVDLVNTFGSNHLQQNAAATPSSGFETLCFTYSGGSSIASCSYYINGAAVAMGNGSNNLTSTINSGSTLCLGAVNTGGANQFIGTMHNAMVFKNALLTPQQVQYLDQLCRRNINRG